MSYIGVDLHTNSMTACYRTKQGKERIRTFALSRIGDFVKTLRKQDKVAVEATGNTKYFVEQIGKRFKKETLGTEKGLKSALAFDRDMIVQIELEVLTEQIRCLTKSIKKPDDQMIDQGKKLKGHKNLASIKGIGDRSATALLSVIGNVKDFADENKLAAYFGIVPRVSDSNETIRHGRITKRGSKIGRTTLVQCTLVATRYSPYLRHYYDRIKKHRGSGKAIIATARKFLGIIYNTLINDWGFEDFPDFVLADS
ncbi:MAG: IS110 family transposase [Planctomycetes bacterium]|nr:IS110 family transposase [Planctomycetota bacterium]